MIDTSKKTKVLKGVPFNIEKKPENIYFCNACGGYHNSKEAVQRCRDNRNAVIKHNAEYKMKHGTISKDPDSVFQFSSWANRAKANKIG